MNAVLFAWLLVAGPGGNAGGGEGPPTMEKADALAAAARAAGEPEKPRAVEAALKAYADLIAARPKDPETVPRAHRRRAALFVLLGHGAEALREHDAIVDGVGSRYDKARALVEGAALHFREGAFAAAEERCRRAIDRYGDERSICAKAALERGRCLEKLSRPREAEASYRLVAEKHADQPKEAIAAYDALALLLVAEGDLERARAALRQCADRFGKEAAKGDRKGAFIGRLLGEMKGPEALAKAAAAKAAEPAR